VIARILFGALLCSYLFLIVPFTDYMKNRPVALKLGYMPEAEVLKLTLGDYRYLAAQIAVVKVLFYFGSLVERVEHQVSLPPEYFNMFKTLQTAVKLDPYNMDAYYFTQAAFTWELRRIKEVNDMLDYGMEYRTWDYNLPFYAGFNAAYFLKDYKTAAEYMEKAARISGEPLFTNLAARYFYEAGVSDLGIIFLDTMQKGARDAKVRNIYELRKTALLAVKRIEEGVKRFMEVHSRQPRDLAELVSTGIMRDIPADPYGGKFYLDERGAVRSTSKFAFGGKNR
jgi:tetratricopeptide (TPR) repeat protein